MSKHIKEMLWDPGFLVTWALSAQPQTMLQHMWGEAVLTGTTQNQALSTLHTEVQGPPSRFFCSWKFQHQHKSMIPSGFGFGGTEFTEEQPQLNPCTEEKQTPNSGDGPFFPLIKQDPQDWNALGTPISLQHSAADKTAKVIWWFANKRFLLWISQRALIPSKVYNKVKWGKTGKKLWHEH